MTGDDGDEFIEAFAEAFDVGISHCPVRRYFESEGSGLISFISAKLRSEKIESERPLSILRLALAIKDKEC